MSIEYENEKIPFINLGQGYKIRLEFEEIENNKFLEKAKNELRETEEVKQQALRELREMIESECDYKNKKGYHCYCFRYISSDETKGGNYWRLKEGN